MSHKAASITRKILFTTLVVTAFVSPAVGDPIPPATVTLVNSLGTASPSTVFSVFGSGGISVLDNQFVGPQFVIRRRTVLTQVGGFLNNCRAISGGIPNCPNTLPLRVDIRPSANGLPDLSRLLASVPLSDDNDPLRVTFEFAALRLPLSAGTYFALFAAEPEDAAFILGGAQDPFLYRAESVRLGVVTGDRSSFIDTFAAVRVLGEATPIPEPTTLLLLGSTVFGFIARSNRYRNTRQYQKVRPPSATSRAEEEAEIERGLRRLTGAS